MSRHLVFDRIHRENQIAAIRAARVDLAVMDIGCPAHALDSLDRPET